jgi:Fur family transcriptional regulator, ferric uptake regulator
MIKETPKTGEIRYELEAEGFRMTKLRSALLEIFAHGEKPFSADEILTVLKKNDLPVHKVTLYRELEVLAGASVIRPIHLHDQILRYESVEHSHHHHVVCVKCKKIADVDVGDNFDAAERKIEKKTKFTILRHSLEFFGLCNACSSASR